MFASDSPIMTQQMFPNYSVLQPDRSMAIQPTTSREGMVYPGSVPSQGFSEQPALQQPGPPISPTSYITGVQSFTAPPSAGAEGPRRHYRGTPAYTHIEIDRNQLHAQTRELDFVASSQKAPPARRGPFRNQGDRERTAETRRIGSCIRCRMQRIRVRYYALHELLLNGVIIARLLLLTGIISVKRTQKTGRGLV